MRIFWGLLFPFLILFNVSCQTNQLRSFEKVQIGMDKSEVLELMGNPVGSYRRGGLDRWRYEFFNEKQLHLKEIQFKDGKVFYVGDETVSEKAAEQDDAKNETSNKEAELKSKAEKESAKQAFPKYEEQRKSKKSRYVPQFKEIN